VKVTCFRRPHRPSNSWTSADADALVGAAKIERPEAAK
jgi:hypothetical protein